MCAEHVSILVLLPGNTCAAGIDSNVDFTAATVHVGGFALDCEHNRARNEFGTGFYHYG